MSLFNKKELETLRTQNRALEDSRNDLFFQLRKEQDFIDNLLNEVFSDLKELKDSLNSNISKKTLKIKIQEIMIKIGGRQ